MLVPTKALTEEEADPVPLAWVPYADRAEAERRLGSIPAGLELDFYCLTCCEHVTVTPYVLSRLPEAATFTPARAR